MSAGDNFTIDRLPDADQVVRLHAATDPGSMDEDAGAALPVLISLFETGDQDRILTFFPWARSPRLWKSRLPALFAVDDEDDLEEEDLEDDEDDLDEDLGDEDLDDDDLEDDDLEDDEDEDDEEEDLDDGAAE